mmetsp:Transcript_29736/g.84816  ORF Transcript_29736/g.84816 Transcript_29736/m.84816 type:complete len:223 (-) Transcript_29736:64-732(-)
MQNIVGEDPGGVSPMWRSQVAGGRRGATRQHRVSRDSLPRAPMSARSSGRPSRRPTSRGLTPWGLPRCAACEARSAGPAVPHLRELCPQKRRAHAPITRRRSRRRPPAAPPPPPPPARPPGSPCRPTGSAHRPRGSPHRSPGSPQRPQQLCSGRRDSRGRCRSPAPPRSARSPRAPRSCPRSTARRTTTMRRCSSGRSAPWPRRWPRRSRSTSSGARCSTRP